MKHHADHQPITSDVEIDTLHTCAECLNEYTVTAGEHQWFAERGWTSPKRCRQCRQARRSAAQDTGGGR